nr:erythroid differentiation and denucleation factor 1 [Homo sapiens]
MRGEGWGPGVSRPFLQVCQPPPVCHCRARGTSCAQAGGPASLLASLTCWGWRPWIPHSIQVLSSCFSPYSFVSV